MSETAVSLMLSDEERALLFEILEERHRALLREIWHTDSRDFKVFPAEKEEGSGVAVDPVHGARLTA
jgi:hypothetical protein